jgi:hypothetical protein
VVFAARTTPPVTRVDEPAVGPAFGAQAITQTFPPPEETFGVPATIEPKPKTVPVQAWSGPIQPGDTLILGFTGRVPPSESKYLRDRFLEMLPDVTVVVLDNVAQIAVYRPE